MAPTNTTSDHGPMKQHRLHAGHWTLIALATLIVGLFVLAAVGWHGDLPAPAGR